MISVLQGLHSPAMSRRTVEVTGINDDVPKRLISFTRGKRGAVFSQTPTKLQSPSFDRFATLSPGQHHFAVPRVGFRRELIILLD